MHIVPAGYDSRNETETMIVNVPEIDCGQHRPPDVQTERERRRGIEEGDLCEPQRMPERFAGQKVRVVGTLDAKTNTIQVDSINAAK